MSSLGELGITAIYLDSTITNSTDSSGNTQVRSANFEWANGSTGTIADYSLQRDTADSIAAVESEVPSDISALPNLNGHGNIYSLHESIVRDSSGELKTLVEEFSAEESASKRAAILDQIILKYAGVTTPIGSTDSALWAKYCVLQKFFGEDPVSTNSTGIMSGLGSVGVASSGGGGGGGGGSAGGGGSVAVDPGPPWTSDHQRAYHEIFEGYYGALMAQTHLKGLYDKISYSWDMEAQKYKRDTSALVATLQEALTTNPEQGRQLLSEFARSCRGVGFFSQTNYLNFRETFIQMDPSLGWVIDTGGSPVIDHLHQGTRTDSYHMEGTDNADAVLGSLTEGDGAINGLNGNDVIYGTDRDEVLINETGDALLVGGGGNDTIYAGADNDILDGGTGNDTLYGEAGNDTYIFRRGSGRDTIIDVDATEGNTDIIWLGGNLTTDDVLLRRVGNNLVLKIKDTTDTLTVRDHFRDDSALNKIEQIVFMDGTVWGDSDILQKTFIATEADDILYRGAENNSIYGRGNGNDTYLFAGAPVLFDRSSVGSRGVYLKTGLYACS